MIEFLVFIFCVAALCIYIFVEFLGPFLYLDRCQKERKKTRERYRNSQKAPPTLVRLDPLTPEVGR